MWEGGLRLTSIRNLKYEIQNRQRQLPEVLIEATCGSYPRSTSRLQFSLGVSFKTVCRSWISLSFLPAIDVTIEPTDTLLASGLLDATPSTITPPTGRAVLPKSQFPGIG